MQKLGQKWILNFFASREKATGTLNQLFRVLLGSLYLFVESTFPLPMFWIQSRDQFSSALSWSTSFRAHQC